MNSIHKLKVKHVAFTDNLGGASRAAFRIHKSLCKFKNELNLNSDMRVIKKFSDEDSIKGGPANDNYFRYYLQKLLNKSFRKLYNSTNPNYFSVPYPSTGLGKELNKDFEKKKFDILNLHWLGDSTLSVKEIGNLNMPLTWRLADQWAFCGCEHYSENNYRNDPNIKEKYITGYSSKFNNFPYIDLNKLFWDKKIKYWKNPINLIAPTRWIADCAKKSILFKNSFISVIPTPLDLEKWSPLGKSFSKNLLGIDPKKKILLFGALGGSGDYRKGGDLLIKALEIMNQKYNNLSKNCEIIIFGKNNNKIDIKFDMPVKNIGIIKDDLLLKQYYSAADVFILPSRQDNLPGTGLESQACGTPVVAFRCGGMPDIIDHHITGSLAKPFDPFSMANEIKWILENEDRLQRLSASSRKFAEQNLNQKRISSMLADHYRKVIDNFWENN